MLAAPADPRARRWAMLALLFTCRCALGLQFQALGSVADPLSRHFGLGNTDLGTLVGLFMLPGLVLSLPAGWAGRHASDRMLVSVGLLATAAGCALAATAGAFATLALARLLTGAGFVFCTIYFSKMVIDWFGGLELATAMSILVMSWPLGIAIGQVGHTWLALNLDWRLAFASSAAVGAAAAAAIAWGYRPPPTGGAAAPAPTATLTRPEWALTALAAFAWASFNAGYIVFLSFAPRVLQAAGSGAMHAAAVISVASWVMIVSATLVGRLADRSGRPALITTVCLGVAVVALPLLAVPGLGLGASLAYGLLGAAPGGIVIALSGRAMAPQRRAFGMGVFYSGYFLLVTLAPPLAGRLVDLSGTPTSAMLFAALLTAGTAVAYVAFEPLRRRLLPG